MKAFVLVTRRIPHEVRGDFRVLRPVRRVPYGYLSVVVGPESSTSRKLMAVFDDDAPLAASRRVARYA